MGFTPANRRLSADSEEDDPSKRYEERDWRKAVRHRERTRDSYKGGE